MYPRNEITCQIASWLKKRGYDVGFYGNPPHVVGMPDTNWVPVKPSFSPVDGAPHAILVTPEWVMQAVLPDATEPWEIIFQARCYSTERLKEFLVDLLKPPGAEEPRPASRGRLIPYTKEQEDARIRHTAAWALRTYALTSSYSERQARFEDAMSDDELRVTARRFALGEITIGKAEPGASTTRNPRTHAVLVEALRDYYEKTRTKDPAQGSMGLRSWDFMANQETTQLDPLTDDELRDLLGRVESGEVAIQYAESKPLRLAA
jgi:hypothetical protein